MKTPDDGKYYEWNEELERNRLETLRRNCRHCQTIIKANVPSDEISAVKIQTCPICATPFD